MTCYRESDMQAAASIAVYCAEPYRDPNDGYVNICAHCRGMLALCPMCVNPGSANVDLSLCAHHGYVHILGGSHFCHISTHYYNHHRPFLEKGST